MTRRTGPSSRASALLALPAAALLLAGCGDPAPGSEEHSHDDGHSHSHEDGSGGTHATEVPGAEVSEAAFELLDSAPSRLDGVGGTAWLATHESGTTVSAELSGLEPGEQYMSHVHADSCTDNDGGPHFAFDPGGPEEPPNEIHLTFTADDDGVATATAESEQDARAAGAESIVVHADDERLVCADF
ncbi:superoxide dismutase family protein [Haloechinothrix sp. YIM 98757]|uniref:Superoxide dismutase family protein n=1 Tax=Haloechinothrix aidingensis TaxID=2752311 RepID=A0A838ACX5_9PSEU|nr:superoxide dismutase family protein [Haloechinothrix aidingensis]MBA0127122.1 superoxide dismutase family protein [Haloechinothrix aidingensis]